MESVILTTASTTSFSIDSKITPCGCDFSDVDDGSGRGDGKRISLYEVRLESFQYGVKIVNFVT